MIKNSLVSTLEKRSKKSPSPSPSAPSHTTPQNEFSSSNPIANSLESDDDAIIGASSSTTTTSSSFLRDERNESQQMRASNTSLNKSELEIDGSVSDLIRYRVEQQRKGSVTMVNSQNTSVNSEKVSFKYFIKIDKKNLKSFSQNCHRNCRN